MNTLITGALCVLVVVCGGVDSVEGSSEDSRGAKAEDVDLKKEFANSLKLSQKLLRESRAIARCYQMTKLPGTHLDLAPADYTFPSLGISSSEWLRLQAEDRLRLMNEALQVYPGFLEELEKWETQEASSKTTQAGGKHSHFSHKINRARLDLRDLLQHVQFQMSSLGMNVPQPGTPQNLPETGSEWHKRLLMYQALRGMEKTVYRVVREYTALCLAAV